MYTTRNTQKQNMLLEQDRRIFRTHDLAALWSIENKNTLLTTIRRYTAKNILYRIYRGLYSTVPLKKLDPYELGCAVSGPQSYITTETVLQHEGVIMQSVNKITLMGKKKREYTFNDTTYLCRYLPPRYLLNRTGISDKKRYSIASPERAVADMLHISPKYFFDNDTAIDMRTINTLQKEIGYT